MSKTYRIELPSENPCFAICYVSRDPIGWRTFLADEAKTWKTKAGARRWLAVRSGIVGARVAAVVS